MDEQFFHVFVKKKIVKFLQLELIMEKNINENKKRNNFNKKTFHFELMESFKKNEESEIKDTV